MKLPSPFEEHQVGWDLCDHRDIESCCAVSLIRQVRRTAKSSSRSHQATVFHLRSFQLEMRGVDPRAMCMLANDMLYQ